MGACIMSVRALRKHQSIIRALGLLAVIVIVPAAAFAINDFSISAAPGSITLAPGASGTSTISTALVSGSPEFIALNVSGVPSGASASFSTNPVATGGSATLTINAGTAALG